MRSLRLYLESHANLVEGILGAHRAPGRVTGGTVGPRLIGFFVQPAPHVRFASTQRLSEDLALGLCVPRVRLIAVKYCKHLLRHELPEPPLILACPPGIIKM